jgi:hypothetical protein
MADWFFTVNGVRDHVEIEFVTPLDNVFTKPVAAKTLAAVADQKNIKVIPHFDLAQVNAGEKTIESRKGEKVGYDLLISIPPNMGDGLVRLLGIVKKLTTPEALDLLARAADIPAGVDVSRAKPVGAFGLLGAMGDPDVKQGMGVLMELTRGLALLKAGA